MGEHIIGRITQTNQKLKYQPGADVCDCFKCTIFTSERPCSKTNNISDWEIEHKDKTCCGGLCRPQPVCVHPDPGECFIGLDKDARNPLMSVEWDRVAPRLKCQYDLDRINTFKQVQEFNSKFGVNNDVEARYCTQKVSDCPYDLKECSRLISTGEGGDICRLWFQAQNDNIKDATIQNYCLRNNTEDCKCVNRSMEATYRSMKGLKSINDGCWYVPCANPSRYLVPSHLKTPECPKNMCNVLFDFIKTGNVSFNDVKNDVNCSWETPPTPSPEPPPPIPPLPPGPTPPAEPPSDNPKSYLKRYWKQVGIILVGLFIMIVLRRAN